MKLHEFNTEINKLGLGICWSVDKTMLSVVNPEFANPMLWFNPFLEEKEYDGSVKVKSINTPLFTEKQIKRTLMLVNELLLTQLEDRSL